MKEKSLKILILCLLVLAKGSTIYWVITIQSSGGFNSDQCYGLISTLIPLFSIYLTIVLKDISSNPYITKAKSVDRMVTPTFKNLIVTFIIFYWFVIIYIINLKPQGEISFEKMQAAVGGVETIFGSYLGYLFNAIFKAYHNEKD